MVCSRCTRTHDSAAQTATDCATAAERSGSSSSSRAQPGPLGASSGQSHWRQLLVEQGHWWVVFGGLRVNQSNSSSQHSMLPAAVTAAVTATFRAADADLRSSLMLWCWQPRQQQPAGVVFAIQRVAGHTGSAIVGCRACSSNLAKFPDYLIT
jgi:hypothetical protein